MKVTAEFTTGRLEQAVGGILFLDEVADMDLEASPRSQLVGALDTGSFPSGRRHRAGEYRCNGSFAATPTQSGRGGAEETFREDLFYHLNVVPLHVPPLREHAEDVPELLNFYVDWYVNHEKLPYRHFNVGAQNTLRHPSLAWQRAGVEEPGAAIVDPGCRQ